MSVHPSQARAHPAAPAIAALLLFVLPFAVHPVTAQETTGLGARLSATTGVTRLAGAWSGTVNGSLLVDVREGVRLGGTATVLLRSVSGGVLSTGEPGELRMAYGGVVAEADLPVPGFAVRILAGGGHITLTDPVVGTRADADSFVVLEPAARYALDLHRHLVASLVVGYRWADGTGGLADLTPGRLHAPVFAAGLTLRR